MVDRCKGIQKDTGVDTLKWQKVTVAILDYTNSRISRVASEVP